MSLLPELIDLVYEYLLEEIIIDKYENYEKYTEISGVKHGKYYKKTGIYEITCNYYLGKLHGPHIEQSLLNKHRTERFYINDEMHGIYRFYDYAGNLCRYSEYKHGKRDGISMSYYSNNRIESISEHKNGMLDGVCKTYDLNGDLMEYSEFKEYKRHGVWTTFHDGIEETIYFKNGKRTWCIFM